MKEFWNDVKDGFNAIINVTAKHAFATCSLSFVLLVICTIGHVALIGHETLFGPMPAWAAISDIVFMSVCVAILDVATLLRAD